MDQVREIGRSYTVELPILSNTNSKFSFGDNETALDNVLITAISLMADSIGKVPSGRTIFPSAEASKGYLTLADGSKKEFNRQLPLDIFNIGERIIHIKPKLISIRNCYIDLPLIGTVVIPAGPPVGFSLLFTFFYEPYDRTIHKINSIGELEDDRY